MWSLRDSHLCVFSGLLLLILGVALINFSTVSLPYPPNIPRFILLPLASQNKITRGDGKTLRALHPLSTPNLAKPSLQYYTSICRSTGSSVEYVEFRLRSRMGATLGHATTKPDFWVSCLWGRITAFKGRRWASIVLLLPFPPPLLLLLPFILNTMTSNNNNYPYLYFGNSMAVVEYFKAASADD